MQIEILGPEPDDATLAGLTDVLVDCVDGGASVGFPAGVLAAEIETFWRGTLRSPNTLTWVAREGTQIVGTVTLGLATMPNGRHRGEVAKLLVHSRARGRGIAGRLLEVLEAEAARLSRTLLILDTESGSSAEGLYDRRGWQVVGRIDDFAYTPNGELAPSTFMVKRLAG